MKKFIVANWKMNPQTLVDARRLFHSIENRLNNFHHVQVLIAPPQIFLPVLSHSQHRSKLCAQNISWADSGALTGEVSASQIKQFRVDYVILGHSERRMYLGETDEMVAGKLDVCLRHNIKPIVCLGGDKIASKSNIRNIVLNQFKNCAKRVGSNDFAKLIFAYEPTYAISTSKNVKPESGEFAADMVLYIRNLIAKKLGRTRAMNQMVLYGGSVNKHNASEYASFSGIDGALVGGASLHPDNFHEVVKEFNQQSIKHANQIL
jgi:triosephosphate isomerase